MKRLIGFIFLISLSFTLFAQSDRATLKGYFETGDKPTQAEFADQIDSQYNLSEDNSDSIPEGSTNLFLTTSERSKLLGIEALAEVNNMSDADATELTNASETILHSHAGTTPPLIWLNGGAGGGPTSDATGTILSINWVVQKYIDTGTFTHSTSTTPTRIYVDVDGTYEVNFTLYLTNANGITRGAYIKKNGVVVPQWQSTTRPADPYAAYPHELSGIVELTAGQYVEVEVSVVFPGGGGTSTVGASNTEIYVTKIK